MGRRRVKKGQTDRSNTDEIVIPSEIPYPERRYAETYPHGGNDQRSGQQRPGLGHHFLKGIFRAVPRQQRRRHPLRLVALRAYNVE